MCVCVYVCVNLHLCVRKYITFIYPIIYMSNIINNLILSI